MNLTTLEISADEARDKLAEYESLVHEERTAEDRAIAAAYRAAKGGLQIIRLSQAIADGGYFDNGMPRIAICRADATTCWARWIYDDLIFADRDDANVNRGALVGEHSVRVHVDPKPQSAQVRGWWEAASTIVPIVPPRFRPRLRRLRGCHVLWEVESWTRVPPRDPALLRHLRGDIWSVLAVWDLTDLERYVLSQRA